jgi:hypothetical protein
MFASRKGKECGVVGEKKRKRSKRITKLKEK